jgi:malate permease and related proteins
MFFGLFFRIMSVFVLIFLGGVARKKNILDADSTTRLATAVKNFFYPALIFYAIFNNFTTAGLAENYLLPAGALMVMVAGYVWGLMAVCFIGFRDEKEKSSFLFQCAINNYSFLPLPIILMLWGEQAAAMLIFSTLGSEIAVWTFGVFALSGNRFRRDSFKNLLSVPMVAIVCAVLAVILRDFFSGSFLSEHPVALQAGGAFMSAVKMLGEATIPLAMFVVGSRIFVLEARHIFTFKQACVAVLRLIVIPATAVGLLFLLPFSASARLVLIVVAVMPAANASVLLSEAYGSDVDFSASSVLITHIFALITIPLWLLFFI